MHLYEKYETLFKNYGVDTPLRIAHIMAQLEHESNLQPKEENLNYSAEGLKKTFAKYFPGNLADLYARQPEKIASRVYANRMGNGNEASRDGWTYRGRGAIQLTGKDNYKALSNYTGLDFVGKPQLILIEANAIISALWFWKINNINRFADKDDVVGVTKVINGGILGLDHRKSLLIKWKGILGVK